MTQHYLKLGQRLPVSRALFLKNLLFYLGCTGHVSCPELNLNLHCTSEQEFFFFSSPWNYTKSPQDGLRVSSLIPSPTHHLLPPVSPLTLPNSEIWLSWPWLLRPPTWEPGMPWLLNADEHSSPAPTLHSKATIWTEPYWPLPQQVGPLPPNSCSPLPILFSSYCILLIF